MLRGVRNVRVAQQRRRFRFGLSGGNGLWETGNRRNARGRAGSNSRRGDGLPGGARRCGATGDVDRDLALGSGFGAEDGSARAAASGAGVPLQRVCQVTQENSSRTMRILSVTETYAPFLEFGGPPVKVRALARGLARHGD